MATPTPAPPSQIFALSAAASLNTAHKALASDTRLLDATLNSETLVTIATIPQYLDDATVALVSVLQQEALRAAELSPPANRWRRCGCNTSASQVALAVTAGSDGRLERKGRA